MRAFKIGWQAIVTFYNEMFLLIGLSLLWWVVGGLFIGLGLFVAWAMLAAGGPWWLAPVAAIPAGPACAALATVARPCVRGLSADRSVFFQGLRTYWRQALGLSAISMAVLALLGLNLLFYLSLANSILRALGFLWLYLILFWLSAQFYLYPILVGMEKPAVLGALKMAALAALANPLFSVGLLLVAAALTALSMVLTILVLMAWPALMVLLGEHSLRLFLARAGMGGSPKDS